jgi:hypothetical protein
MLLHLARRRPVEADWESKLEPPVNRVLPVGRTYRKELWAAFGLSNGGVVDENRNVEAIPSYLGWIGYRHFWSKGLRTNVNVSGIRVDNDVTLTGLEVSREAYSASANIICSPIPELSFGLEYMSAWRKVESGASGRFDRLQFAGRYDFSFSMTRK